MDPLDLVVADDCLPEVISPVFDGFSLYEGFEEGSLLSKELDAVSGSNMSFPPEISKDGVFFFESNEPSEQSPIDVKPAIERREDEREGDEKSKCGNNLNYGVENSGMSNIVSSSRSIQHSVQSNLFSSSVPPQFVPLFVYPPSFPCSVLFPGVSFDSNVIFPLPYPCPSSSVVSNDKMSMMPIYDKLWKQNKHERTVFVNPNEYERRICKNMECLEFHPAAPSREQFCCKECKYRKGNYSKTKNETNIKMPKVCIRKGFVQWLFGGRRTALEVEKCRQEGIEELNKLNECESGLNVRGKVKNGSQKL